MECFLVWKDTYREDYNFLVIYFPLIIIFCENFEAKSWPEHIINVESRRHHSFIPSNPPHFSTQNQDMCHGIIGSGMIEIESHPDQN